MINAFKSTWSVKSLGISAILALGLAVQPAVAESSSDAEQAALSESNPVVLMKTNMGEVTVELYAARAPKTVANFMRYVEDGSYDGSMFHRVIDGFVAQGGGFTPNWTQLPTYAPVANESDNGLSNETATIAMARTQDPDSATRQFYFNLKDNRFLDGKPRQAGYTVFGKVIKGDDVLSRIAASPTKTYRGRGDVPIEPVVLESISQVSP